MAFKKHIVVISGSGSTGLVKLSGSFDGLNKVKGECRCDCAESGSRLYIIADEVTEIKVDSAKTVFEVPVAAKSDVYCLLVTGGRTLTGSSGGRADRRQLEGRIELYKREKLRAAREKRAAAVYVPGAEPSAAAASPAAADGRDVRADDGGNAGHRQSKDKTGKSQEHIRNAHQYRVEPATIPSAEDANRCTEAGNHRHQKQGGKDTGAAADDDPRQKIPTVAVSAHQMRCRRGRLGVG